MIQRDPDELQFILNDSPEPPRLLTVPKKDLRRLLVGLPLTLVAVVTALTAVTWWQVASRARGVALPSLPSLPGTGGKARELEEEVAALTASNKALQKKLGSAAGGGPEVWLGPIKRPYALQDLRNSTALRVENITMEDRPTQQVLRFNLVNHSPNSARISGHVHVLQVKDGGLAVYPAATAADLTAGLRFDQGESFAVSRLRPVEATFPVQPGARYLVLIFNREGDLLVHQEIGGTLPAPGA